MEAVLLFLILGLMFALIRVCVVGSRQADRITVLELQVNDLYVKATRLVGTAVEHDARIGDLARWRTDHETRLRLLERLPVTVTSEDFRGVLAAPFAGWAGTHE